MSEPEHVAHGGSVVKRFWNCPGSIRLSEGQPNRSSRYADEGTAAHELIRLCLVNKQAAEEYVGWVVGGVYVTSETAEYVQVFIDHCNSTRGDSPPRLVLIEERVDLASLGARVPLRGTVDYGQIVTGHRLLIVNDYKHGEGIRVEGRGDMQTRYYALGLLFRVRELHPLVDIDRVRMSIVQPRIRGGQAIQTEEIGASELVEWGAELIGRVEATLQPDAPLHAGDWCKFCPAAPCSEQRRAALDIARAEFATPPAIATAAEIASPHTVRGWVLSPAEVGELLRLEPLMDQIFADLNAAGLALARDGHAVPGWKRVAKKPVRRWLDPESVQIALGSVYEINPFGPAPLLSPAQAEAVLAEQMLGKTKKARTQAAKDALRPLTVSESSGDTLAPDDDARPAISGREALFPALPDET